MQGTRLHSGFYVGNYLCGVNIIGMWNELVLLMVDSWLQHCSSRFQMIVSPGSYLLVMLVFLSGGQRVRNVEFGQSSVNNSPVIAPIAIISCSGWIHMVPDEGL